MGKGKLFGFLTLVVLLSSCGPAAIRRPVVQAPTIPSPPLATLPPRSFDPLVRQPHSPIPDEVDLLVDQTEALYDAGMGDYRSGNLEKARSEFDQALNLLLSSNFDVQADDRLSTEFDKLVENIYDAEVAAIEQGDSLSLHKYESPQIESFANLTFPVDPRIKQRVREEAESVRSDIPLVSNDIVAGVITYLQNHGRGFIETVLKRMGIYKPMISDVLRKEGLPQDLIYLAAGESAFNPFAMSRQRAVGIWQFVLGTAELYGLKRDRWVDQRQDPQKSTQAAARHLKDLYQMFGDWFLAMAAYDSGSLTVQRAIEKTGYADFWKLRELHALPLETENYVPIFLAIMYIAKDPKAYGFEVPPDPPLQADQVRVSVPTDLRLIAQLIDHPVENLIRLNPSLLRWTTPANQPDFMLNLPAGTKDLYEKDIASIPESKRIWWRAHKVEGGETLTSVARKYHVSPNLLAQVNQVKLDAPLEEGGHLVVPQAPGRESSLVRVRERGPSRLYHYRVRQGDTLELVADRFDVTPYQIRRWNGLKTSSLVAGRVLRLYVPGGGRTSPHRSGTRRKSSPSKKPVAADPPAARAGSRALAKSAPASALAVH